MNKKVCIIGAGNIGIPLAVDFSYNENYDVYLYTKDKKRKKNLTQNHLSYYDIDFNKTIKSKRLLITDNLEEACNNAKIIAITYPSFLMENLIKSISSFTFDTIFFLPGYGGGKDLIANKYLNKNCNIVGLDRAPYISRLNSETTATISKKKRLRFSTLKKEYKEKTKLELEELFKTPCEPLNNYLTVNLTPSNPILHTSRLYSLLKDKNPEVTFDRMIKFYKEWDDTSSDIMIKMDNELHNLIKQIPINLQEVIPLTTHYESNTVTEMTKKLSSIQSLQDINAPLILDSNTSKYKLDLNSRYFTEDFPFGLKILIEYALLFDVKTPTMNTVYKCYEDFITPSPPNTHQIITNQYFEIKNYGMNTKENIINFYSR